jgi:hypothetical protein
MLSLLLATSILINIELIIYINKLSCTSSDVQDASRASNTDAIEVKGLTYNLPHDSVKLDDEEAVEVVDEMISICEIAD